MLCTRTYSRIQGRAMSHAGHNIARLMNLWQILSYSTFAQNQYITRHVDDPADKLRSGARRSYVDYRLPMTLFQVCAFSKPFMPIWSAKPRYQPLSRPAATCERYSQSMSVFWISSLFVMTNGPYWKTGWSRGSPETWEAISGNREHVKGMRKTYENELSAVFSSGDFHACLVRFCREDERMEFLVRNGVVADNDRPLEDCTRMSARQSRTRSRTNSP